MHDVLAEFGSPAEIHILVPDTPVGAAADEVALVVMSDSDDPAPGSD